MDPGMVEIRDMRQMKEADEKSPAGKWPKQIPPLTKEEQAISDDFMNHWSSILPGRYGLIEAFNHPGPFLVPAVFPNLCIGAVARPKPIL
jgi:hypothetical protein